MIKELVYKNRSYRRFYQNKKIAMETLEELVDLARHSACGGNLQSLKYILSCDPQHNESIFKRLGWAAYLKDWKGPSEGEKPAAYVVLLGDTSIYKDFFCDHGIACQSILLGAVEQGLGGCIFGTINRDGLRKDLSIDDKFQILLVVALGKPKETVTVEYIESDGDIKYWRDENSVHHVPKRSLQEIIVRKY
ncbi:MAG: nitroreductase family protein [Deltaproteobacteria bacterium]|jgi:nitroreductase|nr:nitroreductase family protein [Deltaproteobacteria bacterium]